MTAWLRGAMFLALWFVLMPSLKPGDLVIGLLAAACATAASLRLLPPQAGGVRFVAVWARMPRFLWTSVLAGIDVARRALHPRLPIKPGFIDYPVQWPRGFARNSFASISSLLPGSVPSGDAQTTIAYHCLDTDQPVAADLQATEQRLAALLVAGEPHA